MRTAERAAPAGRGRGCRDALPLASSVLQAVRRVLPAIAVLLLALPTARAASSSPGTLPWPLDAKPRLTSTFCEPRGQRFHAGVDMSTGGRVGLDLRCPVDGDVVRVSASYYGYGKQLLVEDATGRRYLFAHLLDFREDIETALLAHQRRQGAYETTWYPEKGEFAVRRGEVLARSGDSGSGPPHVHFEVRDGEEPINPLLAGLSVADGRPPELPAVALLPAAAGSLVEGSLLPAARRAKLAAPGRWTVADTLQVDGPFALAAVAIDRVDDGDSRLAPAALRLVLDGDTLLEQRHGRMRFDWNRQSSLVYEAWLRELEPLGRKDPWFRLQRPPSDLPFWRAGDDGLVDPAGWGTEIHRLRIEAEDAVGQVATLELRLRRGRGGAGGGLPAGVRSWVAGEALHVEWPGRVDSLRLLVDGSWRWVAAQARAGGRSGTVLEGAVLRAARLELELPGAPLVLDGGWMEPGGPARLVEPGGAALVLPAGALRRPLRLRFLREADPPALPGTLGRELAAALVPGCPSLTVGERSLSLLMDADLLLPCRLDSASARRAGLVRVGEDGLAWLGGTVRGDTLRATVSRGGRHALVVDRVAPDPILSKGGLSRRDPQPVLVWHARERLSGVASAELAVDGAVDLPRYDPDTDRLLWKPERPLAPGAHALRLRVVDRAGNTGVWSDTLRVLR